MTDAKGIRVALFIILHGFTIMEKQNAVLMALMRDKLGERCSHGSHVVVGGSVLL